MTTDATRRSSPAFSDPSQTKESPHGRINIDQLHETLSRELPLMSVFRLGPWLASRSIV
jgi:hypothetical protein